MLKKFYTVIIVPERGSTMKRFKVRDTMIKGVIAGVAILVSLMGLLTFGYLSTRSELKELEGVREENRSIKMASLAVEHKLNALEARLARIVRLDKKIREVAGVEKSAANTGDVEQGIGGPIALGIDLSNSALHPEDKAYLRRLTLIMDRLGEGVSFEEASMEQLAHVLTDNRSMFSRLPNIWPVSGILTSKFGMRRHPMLGIVRLHAGIDIAAPTGREVIAPADGTVVFAGWSGGYGRLLAVDHGSGFVTRYGHLSKINVEAGQEVRRGESIAQIGTTGQSTGPHLHYEVRLNGLPVDPLKYIIQ